MDELVFGGGIKFRGMFLFAHNRCADVFLSQSSAMQGLVASNTVSSINVFSCSNVSKKFHN